MSEKTKIPIVVYANSGEKFDGETRLWVEKQDSMKDKHQEYADFAKIWVKHVTCSV